MSTRVTSGPASRRLSRRAFLTGAGTAIVYLGGCSTTRWPSTARPSRAGLRALTPWVAITATSDIVVLVDKCEMGQGVRDMFAAIVAEELGLLPSDIAVEDAPVGSVYRNRKFQTPHFQVTGASSSTADAWAKLRTAAAGTRDLLLSRAAERLGPAANLQIHRGVVRDGSSRQIPLADLVRAPGWAADGEPESGSFRVLGCRREPVRPRVDAADKVTGQARFGIDVDARELGQKPLVALVIRPDGRYGGDGRVEVGDASAIRARRGVVDVIPLDGGRRGVAIVADSFWHAYTARAAAEDVVRRGGVTGPSSAALLREYEKAVTSATSADGLPAPPAQADSRSADRVYVTPFGPHAPIEPLSASCVQDAAGTYHVYAATQFPQAARARAADLLGVPEREVAMHGMLAGGSFGRRFASDFILEAAELCRALHGRAVKVMWTREDEFRHDWLRPCAVSHVAATVRPADGRIERWDHRLVSESPNVASFDEFKALIPILRRLPGRGGTGRLAVPFSLDSLDWMLAEGIENTAYAMRPRTRIVPLPEPRPAGVRVGFWRSVSYLHNVFAVESTMDELAVAAGSDPVEFRLRHLDEPRARWCVHEVARSVGRDRLAGPGTGHGLAFFSGWQSFAALAVRVTLEGKEPRQEIRVHEAWAAVDCGFAVCPDVLHQQVEGGIIFGLSAALKQEITTRSGVVQETNFHACDMVRMHECPAIHVVHRDWPGTTAPTGVGELMVPLAAPAVANAIHNLTRVSGRPRRLTRLPLTPGGQDS